jgi:hypothetical protein
MEELENHIKVALENTACLGRDAYGSYIERCTKSIMEKIKELN